MADLKSHPGIAGPAEAEPPLFKALREALRNVRIVDGERMAYNILERETGNSRRMLEASGAMSPDRLNKERDDMRGRLIEQDRAIKGLLETLLKISSLPDGDHINSARTAATLELTRWPDLREGAIKAHSGKA